MHDEVEEVRGDSTALSDALGLVVCVRVAIGVKDFEEWARIDGLDLIDDLIWESHSFENTEKSLVVEAVESLFPVKEGNNAGDLSFLCHFGQSSYCEEWLGCAALRSESVLFVVEEVFHSILDSDTQHDAINL